MREFNFLKETREKKWRKERICKKRGEQKREMREFRRKNDPQSGLSSIVRTNPTKLKPNQINMSSR